MLELLSEGRLKARLQTIEAHIQAECEHNLEALMQTYGETAGVEITSAGERYIGHQAVRAAYADLFQGFPDLSLAVKSQHVTEMVVILEMVMSGTHLGTWQGLAATGKRMEISPCTVFLFDDQDKLTNEKAYFDIATLLTQLGLLPELK